MEALFILDSLMMTDNSKKEKKELLEKLSAENPILIPFLGFEMATGSGKTALMGACT